MADNKVIISLEGVSKWFGDKQVLSDINLKIKQGEFVTLLGPSGCGKSTTLRLIAGFLEPDEGTILLEGRDISELPPHKRPLNTVFQRYALFPHLDVYDNVAFGLKLSDVPEDEIVKRVKKALKMVNMTGYEDRDVESLSGGQQQRVAVARAIINKPKVLLLDEPLAALDLKMKRDMQLEIKEMHKELGITFIYVTHDQEEACMLSDTVVVMNNGKIQQIGTPADIYNEPINSFVADFIGEANILNGTMIRDCRVSFAGYEFDCVDEGFGENVPVDVVVRPEDLQIPRDQRKSRFYGTVTSCTFMGVHHRIFIDTESGYELMAQSYVKHDVGERVGMMILPENIQVMKKERTCNRFEAKVVDATHVRMLGTEFECRKHSFPEYSEVIAEVAFDKVDLQDYQEEGQINAEVDFIIYKGDHYHLTVLSDNGDSIYVDTHDVWDKGDLVGVKIAPEDIKLVAEEK
ncbi:MAG: ATP-binding cassette domain-containing protein [Bacteroidales bacterium]|nr:ATP-binding cassette domain-containing protein [Candidatus Cacconaster equifaecalis]